MSRFLYQEAQPWFEVIYSVLDLATGTLRVKGASSYGKYKVSSKSVTTIPRMSEPYISICIYAYKSVG